MKGEAEKVVNELTEGKALVAAGEHANQPVTAQESIPTAITSSLPGGSDVAEQVSNQIVCLNDKRDWLGIAKLLYPLVKKQFPEKEKVFYPDIKTFIPCVDKISLGCRQIVVRRLNEILSRDALSISTEISSQGISSTPRVAPTPQSIDLPEFIQKNPRSLLNRISMALDKHGESSKTTNVFFRIELLATDDHQALSKELLARYVITADMLSFSSTHLLISLKSLQALLDYVHFEKDIFRDIADGNIDSAVEKLFSDLCGEQHIYNYNKNVLGYFLSELPETLPDKKNLFLTKCTEKLNALEKQINKQTQAQQHQSSFPRRGTLDSLLAAHLKVQATPLPVAVRTNTVAPASSTLNSLESIELVTNDPNRRMHKNLEVLYRYIRATRPKIRKISLNDLLEILPDLSKYFFPRSYDQLVAVINTQLIKDFQGQQDNTTSLRGDPLSQVTATEISSASSGSASPANPQLSSSAFFQTRTKGIKRAHPDSAQDGQRKFNLNELDAQLRQAELDEAEAKEELIFWEKSRLLEMRKRSILKLKEQTDKVRAEVIDLTSPSPSPTTK